MNRKIALAIGAGVIATGGVLASAATLGGLTSGSLGTESAVVAGCTSSGVTVKWNPSTPTYAGSGTAANSTFTTGNVDVTAPESCRGKTLVLTAADNSGASLATSVPTLLPTGTGSVTQTVTMAVNSKLVGQTTVTIYD